MEIKRVKNQYHASINTCCLRDKNITTKAKGIYAIGVSLGDSFTAEQIINSSTDGRSSVMSGINELIDNGYCERVIIKDGNKFSKFYYKWK